MSAASAVVSPVRRSRAVAVRRMLLAALFLGGLLGLALLLGGSAHAASPAGTDRTADSGQLVDEAGRTDTAPKGPTAPDAADAPDAGAATDAGAAADAGNATGGVSAPRTDADVSGPDRRGTGAAPAGAERAVSRPHAPAAHRAGQALDPVAGRVEGITGPVLHGTGDLLRDITGGAVNLPAGEGGEAGPLPLPGTGEDRAGDRPGTGRAAPPDSRHADDAARPDASPGPRAPYTDGPGTSSPAPGTDGPDEHRRDGRSVPPPGMPHGTASAGAADGSSRAGDPHAVCDRSAPRFGPVPGAVRAAAAAPTRERPADILEFPG
ncbi:hypothetical protein [Streptomyces sp. Ru87]|uniref:hypothetical protein n=1 Tax=Streptomyces sp. Ru87 TaxID=2044307 RepID=UPI000BF828CC|nr:hypothetical protein [Streptomyces sp. Ru87]PGH47005.1 hypothetical protein CRI70_30930 [Streptomyces sp. Ru87]